MREREREKIKSVERNGDLLNFVKKIRKPKKRGFFLVVLPIVLPIA